MSGSEEGTRREFCRDSAEEALDEGRAGDAAAWAMIALIDGVAEVRHELAELRRDVARIRRGR